VVPFQDIYPKEYKPKYNRATYTPMFTVAVFIITNFGNSPDA
jgi:hypothetical protein